LEQEIARRRSAEVALLNANQELEKRVQERTADLIRLNNDLREREKDLALARDNALAASRAKDDFVARLSHELRTPLNPVLLIASDASTNMDLPVAVRADFRMIAESIELEARLIDDLLDLTRMSQGKLSLNLCPTELSAVIHNAITMVQSEIDQKKLSLLTNLRAENCLILGDDVRLKQIFWNILKNAVKFTPPGGAIKIEDEILPESRRVLIRVIDTGIGMTPQEIARVFEAFSQGDHALDGKSPRFGGMGLGLTIAGTLAEIHGGSIRAMSAGRNQGATFLVELPMLAEAEPRGEPIQPHLVAFPFPMTGSLRRRRILLVEDHQATSSTLTQLLVRRHYEVVNASCLAEARSIITRERFDVLISDIGLPDGNGCELMSELVGREDMSGIALTGYGMEEDIVRSKKAGFRRHLTKPVNVHELELALESIANNG
jgi:signal transduction histidine kinase